MDVLPNSECIGNECSVQRVFISSESAHINQRASLAGRMFKVPIAFAAMLGQRDRVMCRFGSGSEYWENLKTLPLGPYLASPMVILDVDAGLPGGADLGDLRFAASAPIVTLCGQRLGVLVIADKVARAEFFAQDLAALAELADVIANRIEMRMIASQALESRMQYSEAEKRFRMIAVGAQRLIACTEASGPSEFVNDTWLKL